MFNDMSKINVLLKGGGDLASGIAYRLYQSGFNVAISEIKQPLMVRRTVSFAEAVYKGEHEVEGIKAQFTTEWSLFKAIIDQGEIPVFIKEQLSYFKERFKPQVIIDGRMLKQKQETNLKEASIVIGIGPGFRAGEDVDAVIETCRGHYLGRVIYQGTTIPNTGQPGKIMGYSQQRVLRAPCDGIFRSKNKLGDKIKQGELFGLIGDRPLKAELSGVIRGQIHPGVNVKKGMKIGDIDPRNDRDYYNKISEKALAVGGGTLEAILHLANKKLKEESVTSGTN
ncbi:selenium-dependent molybdenum hydroxylase system protein, YqeB family [Halobacteroides halobius DSM 5150]|uniref:Selenium-dependent molybdenum hydroxylase system protein, YqeB family n=1 Tax=Halobacteroides halobius (strain ATCC 35273 / DSM 5150 / MD-1) TaxID=748449 RepID=L0K6W8_HALHC|nr:selenium-dependent molybdenum cofactor biosynthesis protein YqeB [Halobacteroides halobius]AGB41017.1 selenium-dependent molybdenum hydroxylase system protein, YqeB family [Halobacteroides halobius DSM 5150]